MSPAQPQAARAPKNEVQRAGFPLVLGLDTFGDLTHDENDRPESHAQTIRTVVEQGVLADQVGVDFFGIGEHHTDDFPMPAADVVLGAIAGRTTRIRLGSAVTAQHALRIAADYASHIPALLPRHGCRPPQP